MFTFTIYVYISLGEELLEYISRLVVFGYNVCSHKCDGKYTNNEIKQMFVNLFAMALLTHFQTYHLMISSLWVPLFMLFIAYTHKSHYLIMNEVKTFCNFSTKLKTVIHE